jgi:hypothetical protein
MAPSNRCKKELPSHILGTVGDQDFLILQKTSGY